MPVMQIMPRMGNSARLVWAAVLLSGVLCGHTSCSRMKSLPDTALPDTLI